MSSTLAIYKVGIGWNVASISLNNIVPQPRGNPSAPSDRAYAITGKVYDDGLYMELNWDYIESEAEYLTLITLFGLHNAKSCDVTIYARSPIFQFVRYNGVAQQPEGMSEVKRSNFFIRDLTIRITHLEPSV